MEWIRRKVTALQQKNTLVSIRSQVEENIGKKVLLVSDRGRKRIVKNEGVITDAFPSIFTVKISNEFDVERTVSYTYSDLLTSTVEMTIY
jgi:uncharacterized protein Veg